MYGSLNEKHPNNTSNHLSNEVVAMTKNTYPHFNPEVYKIKSKIATVRTPHHCKYNINYNIIWIPKYRKPILQGKVIEVLKTIIEGQCQELSIRELAFEVMPRPLAFICWSKADNKTLWHNPQAERKYRKAVKVSLSRVEVSRIQKSLRKRFWRPLGERILLRFCWARFARASQTLHSGADGKKCFWIWYLWMPSTFERAIKDRTYWPKIVLFIY